MMLLAAVDWTQVLDSAILALPAIIAAIYAGRVHREIRTPSGPSIGEQVERSHLTAIANNLLLSKHNGPTKHASTDVLHNEGSEAPRVPIDPPPPAQE